MVVFGFLRVIESVYHGGTEGTEDIEQHVRCIGRAVHGDEDRALMTEGEAVDDFQQRRQSAGREADSDEQVCRHRTVRPVRATISLLLRSPGQPKEFAGRSSARAPAWRKRTVRYERAITYVPGRAA